MPHQIFIYCSDPAQVVVAGIFFSIKHLALCGLSATTCLFDPDYHSSDDNAKGEEKRTHRDEDQHPPNMKGSCLADRTHCDGQDDAEDHNEDRVF